ncbi:hypothetical protein [Caudoviricetes sp.]|nr:hypothetical protein [Caudoviricetes sp.]
MIALKRRWIKDLLCRMSMQREFAGGYEKKS